MITLTAFRSVPPFAQGVVRDLRVRWALEEAGLPYRERLIGPQDQATAAYRALQPFGQVPAIEEDGTTACKRTLAESWPARMPELGPSKAKGPSSFAVQ